MTDEDAILAGELALGLLDGEERAAVLRRVLADPAFARAVERWRERFAALNADGLDAAPGPHVEDLAMRATDRPSEGNRKWRWIAAVSGIAAAALLVLTVARPTRPPAALLPAVSASPLLVAVMKLDHAEPVGAVYDPTTRQVRFSARVDRPTGRDLELWAIGGDGVPRAAGLVPHDAARVAAASDVAIAAGTTLAISVEPIGGSPKPTPTGPVIATGKLVAI